MNGLDLDIGGGNDGCVAKTGGSLVEVIFVLTVPCPTHSVHEHLAPIQVASLAILNHPVVCSVVSALSLELPQSRGDDAL